MPVWCAGLACGWAVGSRGVSCIPLCWQAGIPRWGAPRWPSQPGFVPPRLTMCEPELFPWLPPQGDITALPAAWGPPGRWCQPGCRGVGAGCALRPS